MDGRACNFNPRTPRGVRPGIALQGSCKAYFNPRTPRGVRHLPTRLTLCTTDYFNPRTPRGVRLGQADGLSSPDDFNPRTPRGVRLNSLRWMKSLGVFQSTHPSRGATQRPCSPKAPTFISIHAPLAGCDMHEGFANEVLKNFNPRTPRGVRPWTDIAGLVKIPFQSTHPSRGAT